VGLGLLAGSVALVAFGADSFIETAAGAIVLWRLTGSRVIGEHRERAERRASRAIAATFFLLAAYLCRAVLLRACSRRASRRQLVGCGDGVRDDGRDATAGDRQTAHRPTNRLLRHQQ